MLSTTRPVIGGCGLQAAFASVEYESVQRNSWDSPPFRVCLGQTCEVGEYNEDHQERCNFILLFLLRV